jgi:heme oxygenase (biliverdin-IX-beta and delta-forming)
MESRDVSSRKPPRPRLTETAVIEALRAATRSRHTLLAASAPMTRLLDAGYTVAEYRVHLGRLLGLFEPLESAAAAPASTAGFRYAPRRSTALREDLLILGATVSEIDALARCRRLPALPPAGLWGYAYVILGSMLGGRIIVQHLRASLGADVSCRFYGDGNGSCGASWASFCADVERSAKSDLECICATAVSVFDVYAEWLSEPRPVGPSEGHR